MSWATNDEAAVELQACHPLEGLTVCSLAMNRGHARIEINSSQFYIKQGSGDPSTPQLSDLPPTLIFSEPFIDALGESDKLNLTLTLLSLTLK